MKTVWLNYDQRTTNCPYCRSWRIKPCRVLKLWICLDCGKNFLVRHHEKREE